MTMSSIDFKIDNIELAVPSTEALLINDIYELLNKIISKLDKCVHSFKSQDLEKAKVQLNTIVEALDLFILSSSYICSPAGKLPYKELQIHLLSVIKAVSGAVSKEDTIMLTDLLEYELKDNLTQWKIHVLTNLKHQV